MTQGTPKQISAIMIKDHEDEDSMRTQKLLSSVLEDEDTRTRIPCLIVTIFSPLKLKEYST